MEEDGPPDVGAVPMATGAVADSQAGARALTDDGPGLPRPALGAFDQMCLVPFSTLGNMGLVSLLGQHRRLKCHS